MLKIKFTNSVKKDLKKYKHEKNTLIEFQEIIKLLAKGKKLPAKNRCHNLTGNWADYKECHIKGDVLLIYRTNDKTLFLTRFGSHSELFR